MTSGFPLEWNGYRVASSEALYQAQKFYPDTPEFKKVLAQTNPFVSKNVAKSFDSVRPDWHDIKLDIMYECLLLKYEQHRIRIDQVLDETENLPIVEKSRRDQFWGAINTYRGYLEGENVLGQLWMIIREGR